MNLLESIEKSLKLKLMDGFGTLLPRSVIVEKYSDDPGMIGNGDILKETESYRIQLIYNSKNTLDKDVETIKRLLIGIPGCSLPRSEQSSDAKNKKWISVIYFEMEGD